MDSPIRIDAEPLIIPDGYNAESYLREIVEQSYHEKRIHDTVNVQKESRVLLEEELSVITVQNSAQYFLDMWHLMNTARKQGHDVGVVAASATGEVSFLLDIIDKSPVGLTAVFEKFSKRV